MNFKFKLSRRLAIALAMSVGCKLTAAGPEIARLERIDVSPARLSLVPFQAAPLTITPITSRPDSTALGQLQWSTTGGGISINGAVGGVQHLTYTAPAQTGVYYFNVTTVTGTPTGTAEISVNATPAPVNGVAVAPASLSIALGDTVTLRATLTEASGAVVVGRPISWSVSDQTVATVLEATGFVRALKGGSVTITATSEGHTGTAVVTVN